MKKLFYMISAVALMASFASCNKIEQENAPVADSTTTLTVSATVPQTKTYWSGGNVKWVTNDVVKVFASDGTSVMSQPTTSASATYDFTVSGWTVGKTPLYAVYNGPAGSYVYDDVKFEDENLTLVLDSEQVIHHLNSFDKETNISVGELTDDGSGVYGTKMKNVCGLLKFGIGKLTDVTEVVIEDQNSKSVAGTVKVKMVDGIPVVQEVVEGTGVSEVSVKVGSRIGQGDDKNYFPASTEDAFYVCVLPGTYLPKITIISASAGTKTLIAKSEITVKRNEWIDFGAIDSAVPGSEEDEPVVPAETKTITLDFSAGWPLSPELAKYVKGEGPQIAQKTTYTLTQDDATYSFEVYSTGAGYYNTGTALRLSNDGTSGYITTPAIPGFKLTGADVTVTNGSGVKNLTLCGNCTVSDGAITVSGKMESIGIDSETTKTGATSFSETAENTSYYLYTPSKNYQLGKLILTYTKVN